MQFLLNKLQKMSLTRQFMLVIAVILCIPAIAVCIYYNVTYRNSLVSQCHSTLQADVNQMSSLMNSSLDKAESALSDLSYQQEFPYFLNSKSNLSSQEIQYFTSKLNNGMTGIRNLYPSQFNGFYIFSSNHQIPESMDYYSTFTYMEQLSESSYQEEIQSSSKDLFYGQIRYSDSTYTNIRSRIKAINNNTLILPLYQKIRDLKTRETIGILEVDTTLQKLIPVEQLYTDRTPTFYFLYHPKSNLLYSISGAETDGSLTADFQSESPFASGTLGSKPVYLYYEPSGRTGLICIAAQFQEDVFSSARRILTFMLLFILTAFALISILAWHAVQMLLARLFEMTDMMQRIEQGEFQIHMKETGSDEITQIARSFNQMAGKLQDMVDTLVAKDKLQKETELRALEAQINPHFLYNTLENMRMQCEIDEYYLVGDALAALGDLFRYSIRWTDNMVPLALEWKNLNNYISIMQMRYGSKLSCYMDYGSSMEEIDQLPVPKLSLQPLVENCFNHGFRNRIPPYNIWISADLIGDELRIEIRDNGSGISTERLEEIRSAFTQGTPLHGTTSKHSIGVMNVKERIEHTCPQGSYMEIDSVPEEGTTITIHIRVQKGDTSCSGF